MLTFPKKNYSPEIDPLDIYLFDSVGVAIIRNAIPINLIELAKKSISNLYSGAKPWKFPILDINSVFWDIMINPKMLAMVEQLCGEQFRLDHAFGVSSENIVVNLHGGPNCSFGSCFSQVDNITLVSQLSCGFPLTPQSPATGGMCYIPGSHKSKDARDGRTIRKDLLKNNLNHEAIVVPTLNPGDLILFSESLIHGDNGWLPTDYHRLIVYYKFCPGFSCWRDPKEQERYMPMARTDLERRLLEPPWSGKFSDLNHIMDRENKRRAKTL